MRTVIHRTASLFGGLALLAGILLALSAPARAQTITATPQNVIVANDAAQGATTITWDAGAGIKNLGATLWQQIDGGKEKLVAAKAKGSQSILIGAGETRVFKLHNFIKSKVLASVTVTASQQGAAPDEDAPNAGGAPAANDAPANTAEGDKQGDDDESPVSFRGTWQTMSDGKDSIPLTMVQNGAKVTGIYPGNNGKLEGTVSGRVLRFKWESDGGSGSGRFVMDESTQAFSGTYNRGDDPDEVDATWNGKRPVSFAGVWKVVMISTSMTMNLQQSGNQVTGEFQFASAGVSNIPIREGVVVGNTLRFKVGRLTDTTFDNVEVVMDEGGKSFRGHIGDAFVTGSFLQPKESGSVDKPSEKVTPPPISFTGVWKALRGTTSMTLTLQQTGDQVTGQFERDVAGSSVVSVSEGIVVGNTLRFKFKLAPADRSARGSGELVLAEDGKSFKGYIAGAATTGTFVQP